MFKKVKVIFLTRSYYPNIGGVEKHIYELSKQLIKQGYKITIITEDTRTSSQQMSSQDYALKGVSVLKIPIGKNNWFKKFSIWKWMWANKELFIKADLIHCHDVFFWYLPLAIIYPLKPVYTTFHGYESYPIKFKAVVYRKIFEHMSNKTICVGDFMRKWYHANPTKVIYGAVNLTKNSAKAKKNSAIFIGRLDEHTGIDVYVQAVRLLRKTIPDFTLTVYGDGSYKEKIKEEGIILKGEDPYADKEIPKFEYAFVSRYLTILEAMAAKRVVVAVYDNPVKKDYLQMTPYKDWIIITSSAQELAKKIITYSINKKENIRIEKSYNWVKNKTWKNLMDDYESLWGKLDV